MKKAVLIIVVLFSTIAESLAQCAMCKTTIVNNVSHGELSLAEGLNFGIMYLFVTPYLAIIVIGFLWYRKSRIHAKSKLKRSTPVL
ncbi:hypothetical protein [Reichenbachiella sp.]|uniref:hypothetical protein n=1 Tax=Reichenbachiella sp. TaxID=2184521 RepID=UPI003BAFE4DD